MRFDTLEDWLRWQETLHPSAIELGLSRVAAVWARMGHKRPAPLVITVAGTNGKGSCVALLEAVYAAAGYRAGCYTSPHVLRYNERVRIDGREADDAALCAAFARVDAAREGKTLTYFEFGTLAALDLFARSPLDLAILEVGLGGRLDAVNVIDADLALISAIGLDHVDWLGETIEEIAAEKAGILRGGRPGVIGHREPARSLHARAAAVGAELVVLGRDFDWVREGDAWRWMGPGGVRLELPLPGLRGRHQLDNAAAVTAAVTRLSDRLPVPVAALRQGLVRARVPGRFQVIPGEVTWILDVAHNPQAAETLAATLAGFHCPGRVYAVLGVMRDKDAAAIARPLSDRIATWHLGQAAGARARPAGELRALLEEAGLGPDLRDYATLDAALDGAAAMARPGDCVVVYGSFTTVEAALRRAAGR